MPTVKFLRDTDDFDYEKTYFSLSKGKFSMCFTYFLSALKTQKPSAVKNVKNTISEKMGKTETPSILFKIFLNIVLFVYKSTVDGR